MTWSSAPWRITPTLRGCGCTLRGGFVLRCNGQTAPWSSGRRARRKAGSSVRCWRISSCTTRSICGCGGRFRSVPFERYADDAIVHCRSERQAEAVLDAIRGRFAQCGLELHPTKTRIVYCKDDDRRGEHEHVAFDFLGYTFQPRRAKNRWGKYFVSFLPAISTKAAKAIRATIREWRMASTRNNQRLEDLARARQPGGAGLDELLRPVLPVEVCPSPAASQRGPRCMGATEVQAVSSSRTSVDALAGSASRDGTPSSLSCGSSA